MASVDGKTSFKIDELVNDTIVDGEIVSGHLILRNRAGAEIDAGVVATPAPDINALDFMPVGYIYMSVVSTSPATLFGGGTWSRIGQGRVLVGQDGSQTEFDTPEETGGVKTQSMTVGQMPAHHHSNDHNHAAFNTGTGGNHTHNINRKTSSGSSTGVVRGGATSDADGTTVADGSHLHTANVPAYSGDSGSVGSDLPMTNLQPYLVVYMWKRTA